MLAVGAVVGLVAGLVAQLFVGGVDGELGWLVRLALLLPAVVFVGWWLLVPGLKLEEPADERTAEPAGAAQDGRVERIAMVFDSAAVPSRRRHRIEPADSALRETYRASVRRDRGARTESKDAWGIRRSTGPSSNGTLGD